MVQCLGFFPPRGLIEGTETMEVLSSQYQREKKDRTECNYLVNPAGIGLRSLTKV